MISRVAEGCFWLTRYLERTETLARLLDVHHALHIDTGVPIQNRWRMLLEFTGREDDFAERYGEDAHCDGELVQEFLTWDEEHPASLYGSLRGARENARTVRETMSLEAWKAINDLWLWLKGPDSRRLYQRERGAFYERVTRSAYLFHGVSFGTMLHDEPFTFMKLGRALERAGSTARILRAHAALNGHEASDAEAAASCLAVLRCCCAYDPFFLSGMHPLGMRTVIRFLLFDHTLPRSVIYNLDEGRRLLFLLCQHDPIGLPRRSRSVLERLRGGLMQMDVRDVEQQGLKKTLAWTIEATDHLCDAIHDDFLAAPTPWLRHCVRALALTEGSLENRGWAA